MKRNHAVTLLAMAALLALPAMAATVDEIVEKSIEAQGGKDAWKAVESVRMKGIAGGGGMELPFVYEWKRPDRVRIDVTLQGVDMTQAFDGQTGWTLNPMMGQTEAMEMDPDTLKMTKEQAEFEPPYLDYAEKGHTLELVGEEEVDGTPAYKLKLTRSTGDVDHIYIDTEYYLVFRQESAREIQGMEINVAVTLGDYKEVGGLLMAHSMEQAMQGAPTGQAFTIETIELNADIPDERFAMPEPEPEPEPEAEEAPAEEGGPR